MKLLLIFMVLLMSTGCYDTSTEEANYKQVYYDCYYLSQNMFKKISKIEYEKLNVEDMCDGDTSFLEGNADEACLEACRDAFNHYK